MRQLNLTPQTPRLGRPRKHRELRAFGGISSARGNPRMARPLRTQVPIHVVMKSSLARGPSSLLSPCHIRFYCLNKDRFLPMQITSNFKAA
ncbi:MAG: hypothetical protein N2578_06360 [Bdellovibrionaceae bacterium]|nr:hypothetical protein [Pseudobdellovibrionaceae bacterium]